LSVPGAIPVTSLLWVHSFRIIPSRFPPVRLFEEVADPVDLDAVLAVESLTNERLRAESGDLALLPAGERVSGPGTGFVMAAFTHVSPSGGRFHDGTFGAYYAARSRATAIAETVHHRERFLRDSAAPPLDLDMRVLRARIEGRMHDLRGARDRWTALYDPDDHAAGRELARELRAAGSDGVAWDSLRDRGGECVAAFRPRCVTDCKQAEHLGYRWNGERIDLVWQKRVIRR
jgi:hypothetical protein